TSADTSPDHEQWTHMFPRIGGPDHRAQEVLGGSRVDTVVAMWAICDLVRPLVGTLVSKLMCRRIAKSSAESLEHVLARTHFLLALGEAPVAAHHGHERVPEIPKINVTL